MNTSQAHEDIGYTRKVSHTTNTQSNYTEWLDGVRIHFRTQIEYGRIYTLDERHVIITQYMQGHIRSHLPKYLGTMDYGVKWREIQKSLMQIFDAETGKYQREITKNNALVNAILVKEHVQQNSHVYEAEWIE